MWVPQLHVVHNLERLGGVYSSARLHCSLHMQLAACPPSQRMRGMAQQRQGASCTDSNGAGALAGAVFHHCSSGLSNRHTVCLTSRSTYLLMCCTAGRRGWGRARKGSARLGASMGSQADTLLHSSCQAHPTPLCTHLWAPLNELERHSVVALLVVRQDHKAKGPSVEVADLPHGRRTTRGKCLWRPAPQLVDSCETGCTRWKASGSGQVMDKLEFLQCRRLARQAAAEVSAAIAKGAQAQLFCRCTPAGNLMLNCSQSGWLARDSTGRSGQERRAAAGAVATPAGAPPSPDHRPEPLQPRSPTHGRAFQERRGAEGRPRPWLRQGRARVAPPRLPQASHLLVARIARQQVGVALRVWAPTAVGQWRHVQLHLAAHGPYSRLSSRSASRERTSRASQRCRRPSVLLKKGARKSVLWCELSADRGGNEAGVVLGLPFRALRRSRHGASRRISCGGIFGHNAG